MLFRLRSLSFAGVLFLWVSVAHALTLTQLITQVRQNIRDTATSASLQRYSDSIITGYLNEGQRDVVNQTWVISKSTAITLVAGTTYYSLPTDLIAIQRVTQEYESLPEVTLEQQDADANYSAWESTGGAPTYFFQDKSQTNKIGIAPYPTSGNTGTLRIIYFAYATDLSGSSDEPYLALDRFDGWHDLLVLYATYRILYIEAMWDKARAFKEQYDARVMLLRQNYGARPQLVPEVPIKVQKGG